MTDAHAFHFNSTGLAPGSVILPGNWGRIILKAKQQHDLWTRENALETVRATEFPALPSRLQCAFFFERLEDAAIYAQTDFSRYVTMLAYKVRLLDPNAPRHHADWNALPSKADPANVAICKSYWCGVPKSEAPCRRETLAVTAMEIIEQVDIAPNPAWKW